MFFMIRFWVQNHNVLVSTLCLLRIILLNGATLWAIKAIYFKIISFYIIVSNLKLTSCIYTISLINYDYISSSMYFYGLMIIRFGFLFCWFFFCFRFMIGWFFFGLPRETVTISHFLFSNFLFNFDKSNFRIIFF